MHNLAVLSTHQPEWLYTAVADVTPEVTPDTLLLHQPGVRGLENAVLEHLVQSRYAAAVAGADSWAIRTAVEIQSVAGAEHGATVAQTEAALRALEGRGLIRVDTRGGDTAGWCVTPGGAAAVERAFGVRLPHAA